MNKSIYYTVIGFLLIFLQIVVINNILLFDYITPYIYIAFVFFFPLRQSRFYFLVTAFILGLLVDVFSDSGGIHAFATLTIAFTRLIFINLYFRKTAVDYPFFSLLKEPYGKIFNYIVTLTIIHHLLLFTLANFSFNNLFKVFTNTVYSSIFTLFLLFLGSYIFTKKE